MVAYLWKFLWKKTQSSLRYIKIALCAVVVYLLILSIFSRVFQANKKNLYPSTPTASVNKNDAIRAFITDKKINSTKTGRLVVSLYKGATCSLIGEACYSDLDKKNPSNTATAIASVFAYPLLNPPASGVGTTMQTLAQAGLIPKSYAAEGVGFASISPLMNVWKAMRDVAYLLLVLVIVTIGFMIMFRTKINPQTIVNVENALPKIIMALIYITFSFAIAGFLIDLMYIVIVLIIVVLGPETGKKTADLIPAFLLAGPWKIFEMVYFNTKMIFITLPNALLNILGGVVGDILRLLILIATSLFINPFVGRFMEWVDKSDIPLGVSLGVNGTLTGLIPTAANFAKTWLGVVLSIIIGVIGTLLILGVIIFITVLMLFFRIFFLLFSTYIKLFVLIIISTLWLLMEAIPGQSAFSNWIKNLLEILVAFPVIIATFLIGSIIINASTQGAIWTPPFLVGLNAEYLSAIIGMWILFMIPDFVGVVQKAVNPKPLPALDAGIGTFFGGAKTGVETGLGEMSKYAILAGSFAPLGRVFEMIPGFKNNNKR